MQDQQQKLDMELILQYKNFDIIIRLDKYMQTANFLKRVGDKNKYQIFTFIFVCFKWLIISLTVFLPSYLFVTPTFTCGTDEKVYEKDACPRISECRINYPGTITAHMNLYCDDKYVRDSIISVEFVGSIIGLIMFSLLADKVGRKFIIVSSIYQTFIGAAFLTLGAINNILGLLYVGQILMGSGGNSLTMVSFSYLSQINDNIWRQRSLILTYAFWAIGQILLYPVIVWLHNWETICVLVFIIPLLALFALSYFIVETPQFLYVRKRYDECLQSLNYIALFNGKGPLKNIQPSIVEEQKIVQQITSAFTKQKFVIPLVILSFAQLCNNGLYYATQYSISQLGESFEFNMLIIGCLQLVTSVCVNFYCDKLYRKRTIILFLAFSGGISILIQFATTKSIFELFLIGIIRVAITFAFGLFSLITTESFPTQIRSTGIGVTGAFADLGIITSPFLVTIGDQIGVKGIFICGIASIVGAVSMFFVKQTKMNKKKVFNPLLKSIESVQDIDQIEQSDQKRDTLITEDKKQQQ